MLTLLRELKSLPHPMECMLLGEFSRLRVRWNSGILRRLEWYPRRLAAAIGEILDAETADNADIVLELRSGEV